MKGKSPQLLLISAPPTQKERALLESFDEKVYRPAFPDDDERESLFEEIVPRLGGTDEEPASFIILAIQNGVVLGGEIFDWYPSCNSLEIIYIAVSEETRQGGIGSLLLKDGTATVVQAIEQDGSTVKRVYFETENPDREQDESLLVMSLYDRIHFFGKHQGAVVLHNYFQPPLSPEKGWADNMMLCMLPVFRFEDGEITSELESFVPIEEVMNFLTCFFDGLDHAQDTPEGKEYLAKMRHEMESDQWPDRAVLTRIEYSRFKIPYVTIASHCFVESSALLERLLADDEESYVRDVFNSYECDIMRSGLQENEHRPVITRHYKLIEGASIRLPDRYQYNSEGEVFPYRRWDAGAVQADISLNWSYHRQRKSFLVTIVVSPSEDAFFNEHDVLKLIAAFGFGSLQENYTPHGDLHIDCSEGSFPSFRALIRSVFQLGSDPIPTRVGITELDLLDIQGDLGFERIEQFNDDILSEGPQESDWNKTLCGFFLGIFDYERMNSSEIADTVQPFQRRRNTFMQVFRGNLLKVNCNSTDERIDKTLTSAYLIIPSVILAFNQAVLTECKEHLAKAVSGRRADGSPKRMLSSFDRFSFLSGEIKAIEDHFASCYVRDIFQYESEKMIMLHGSEERGLTKDSERLKEALSLQKDRADEIKDKYTGGIDTIQNIILLILALLQVANIKDIHEVSLLAKIAIVASLVIGFFIFFRKRKLK